MRILMFSWKDLKNPAAGGAEVMTGEILKKLAAEGHQVTLFTSRYTLEAPSLEVIDGVEIYRAGGRFGVYFWAIFYYFKRFRDRFDLVIDQVNTLPFFTPLFVKERKLAFFPQLARALWFYETRFPIALVGYLLEPIFLLLYQNVETITISQSSKDDLAKFGLKRARLVPVVSGIRPLAQLPDPPPGFNVGFVGRFVPGKRVLDAVEAFALVKKQIPKAKFYLVGRGTEEYQKRLKARIKRLGLADDVTFRRNATAEERNAVFGRLHALLVTSVKEGWGLVVTEANSYGVPALVYNVDGLRDSVKNNQTGLICQKNSPTELAGLVVTLYEDHQLYERLRRAAWADSKNYTLEKTSARFLLAITEIKL